MGLEEAKKLIEELKGRFDAPFSSSDKGSIERLYYEVTGRSFVPTSCQQCYHDALIELVYYLNKNGKMAVKCNYRLKAGAIINSPIFMDGKVFSNDNLTDEVAREYLEQFPEQEVLFQQMPVEKEPEDGDNGAGDKEGIANDANEPGDGTEKPAKGKKAK